MANVARDLQSIAGDIRNYHDKVKAAHGKALEHAKKAGEALAEAKEQVNHGDWATWLERNAPEVSDRTARVYMRIANNWEEIESKTAESADLSIDKATKLIGKPKPKPASTTSAQSGDSKGGTGSKSASTDSQPTSTASAQGESGDSGTTDPGAQPDAAPGEGGAGDSEAPGDGGEPKSNGKGKSGKQKVSTANRKNALAVFGQLTRLLQKFGVLESVRPHMEKIHEAIKGVK